MKKLVSLVLTAGFVVLTAFGGVLSASAHQIGHVWCGADWVCRIAYANANYWMVQRYDSDTWVRVTLVAGANNTHVAPITCATRDACVVVYYKPYQLTGYWMAKLGNTWVRLTDV